MIRILFKFIVVALTVYAMATLSFFDFVGIHIHESETALWVALALGVLNLTIRPILYIFTLPINIITFGLFSYVLNALILLMVPYFVPGFIVDSFFAALIGATILACVRTVTRQ